MTSSSLLASAATSAAAALAMHTAGAQAPLPPKAETCVACHGPGGNASQPQYPILAGQTARYLYLQLRDFKAGRRKDPLMSPMAQDLNPDEMRALADYFAAQPKTPTGFKPDPAKAALGKVKADETLCTMCHLGGFKGQNETPRVAGQHFDYIVKQLSDFKARRRTNDAGTMTSVSNTLSDEDIQNIAHYVAGL